jgi:hypothetical protein
MRIPVLPATLLLLGGGLLYSAFHTNKRVLEVTDERPRLAFPTATDLAASAKASAERYFRELGIWPEDPADVDLDTRWMNAHRGIESVGYDAGGKVRVQLAPATDGPAALIVWTPGFHGDQIVWDCVSDYPKVADHIEGCRVASHAELAAAGATDTATATIAGLSEPCQKIGKLAHAAANARADGKLIVDFLRNPLIVFTDDEAERAKLEEVARRVYEGPARNANSTRRNILRDYRCLQT